MVVHNHPYHGSSHTPDLAIVVPVFFRGRLVGFAANTAHHVDIGAATPGLIIDVPDVFAEGHAVCRHQALPQGRSQQCDVELSSATTAAPPCNSSGDIEAQVASARLGAKRFVELLEKYGEETVFAARRRN